MDFPSLLNGASPLPETCLKARLGHVEEDAMAFAQELLCEEEISTSVPRPAAPAPAEARAPRPSTHLGAGAATEAGIVFRGAAPPAVVVDSMARPAPLRQTIFNDVLAQLAAKEEAPPLAANLYALPSMRFLEGLLDEMDHRAVSAGRPPAEPPLYLPVDEFDLACEAAAARPAPPLREAARAFAAFIPVAPEAGSAAPSPTAATRAAGAPPFRAAAAAARRLAAQAAAAGAYDDFGGEDDEAMEVSVQTSKSGRVRKVASFAGAKRRADALGALGAPALSHLHASLGGGGNGGGPTASGSVRAGGGGELDSDDDASAGVSRGASRGGGRRAGGRRTVCLNCGACATPQWRCGPLGPRTLCNACGVRYKKGLPLSCWPLRDGLVLPPGAVLPAHIAVPDGWRIVTQPAA